MSADADPDRRWLAFEAEALPHADRLFRHAMWLAGNRAEAEDLVQETMVQALQSFHRFTPGTNCRAWLVTILQHVRSNRLRKQGRVIVDSALEERAANVVPFVPPIPDRLTDEDMLLALSRGAQDGRQQSHSGAYLRGRQMAVAHHEAVPRLGAAEVLRQRRQRKVRGRTSARERHIESTGQ